MKNILFITNIPSPYRINLFRYINVELGVKFLYTDINEKGRRKWKIDFGKGYDYKLLKKIKIFKFEFSFDLINQIKNSELVVIGGVGLPLMQQAVMLCKLLRKPYVIWTDGGFIKKENKIKYLYKRFLIKNAMGYITTGVIGKKYLLHYGAKEEKIKIIPLTGDTDLLSEKVKKYKKENDLYKLKSNLELKGIILLFVGTIENRKGIWHLINVYKKIKYDYKDKVSLLIVGDGDKKNKVEEKVKEFNLENIHITGFIQPDEIYKYYSLGTIFVFPTLNDPWGLVINEAMASSLPVISTDMAGASFELLKNNKNGFMIKAGDEEELYEKIKFFLDNPDKINEFGKEAYNTIKNINNKTVAKDYSNVLKEFYEYIN